MPTKKKVKKLKVSKVKVSELIGLPKQNEIKVKPKSRLAEILGITGLFLDELNRNNKEVEIDPIKTVEYIQERLVKILEAVRTNSKID